MKISKAAPKIRDTFFFFYPDLTVGFGVCAVTTHHRIGGNKKVAVLGLYRRWGNEPRPERKN